MPTRAYLPLTPANTVDVDLENDVVAFRVISNANLTVVTYVDSARTIAATTAPTAAPIVVVSDRAMGRFVRITSTGATSLGMITEEG